MLMHAEWGGRALIEGATVLDVFAGTGALGLEALSRGAASACFIESDPAALRALRTNIATCGAEDRTEVLAIDVLTGEVRRADRPASVVFLDPPYGRNFIPRALVSLRNAGRIGQDALIVAEVGRDETWVPDAPLLAERHYGAARVVVFRETGRNSLAPSSR
jgi:16S rRNA (guanine966-N2)-methyltransferase